MHMVVGVRGVVTDASGKPFIVRRSYARILGEMDCDAQAAAGALEYLPLSRVTNIARALDLLKGEGLWVYGADVAGGKPPHEVDLTMPQWTLMKADRVIK